MHSSDDWLRLGIGMPEILLPKDRDNLRQWCVVACDQYTSDPVYWQAVDDTVGDSPSTLRMVLPEVFLGTPDEQARRESVGLHYSTDYPVRSGDRKVK